MTNDDTPAREAGTIDDAQPADCREELAAVLRARDMLAAVDTDALGDDVGAYLTNALEALDSLILRSDALRILAAEHRPRDDRRDTGNPVTDGGVSDPEVPKPSEVSVTVNVTAEVGQDVLDRVARLLAYAGDPTPADAEDHLLDHLRLNDEYVTKDGRDAARVALERAETYRAGTATDANADGGDE